MYDDSKMPWDEGENKPESRIEWQFDEKTRSFSYDADADMRRESWYGSESPSYRKSRVRNGGRRGLKVFALVMASLLFVVLLAYGFSVVLGDLPDELPPPGGTSPPATRQTAPTDPTGDPLFGQDDAPDLQIYNRPNPIFDQQADGLTIPEIAAVVSPCVVGIVAEGEYAVSYGSGIISSANGYIVTNAHVIEGGSQITVVDHQKNEYEARVVGRDKKADLAVLRIQAENLPAATFGNSDELVVGELAVAIGNPMSMELFGSVTVGIISALDRHITLEDRTMVLLQTDAAINPGNSGGALVNAYGQVIGINSVKVMPTRSSSYYEGIGFAIPSNSAMPVIEALIRHGYVPGRPSIGIVGEDVDVYYSNYFNVPRGVFVHSATEGGDAAAKGLIYRDIIIAIEGTPITSMAELNAVKDNYKAGDTVTLTIYRKEQTFDVEIVLTEQGRE